MSDFMASIAPHFPALVVVIPMLAAAFCAFTKSGSVAWGISTIAIGASFFIALDIFSTVIAGDPLSYHMGGWQPPYGIEYKTDPLNSFVILLVTLIGLALAPYAKKSIEKEIDSNKQSLFYSVYLLCFAGLLGILSTNDIFNIYVFLEISSLSTYSLIAMGKDRRSLASSFEYLILGTIGATFILIGVGLIYMMTGTLNITDLSTRLPEVLHTRPVEAAFAFLTLGIALKTALFPLHIWLTNAYAYSPSFVSAFLSSTATKVSAYLFIRVIYDIFGYDFAFIQMPLGIILITLAFAGIFISSITAIYQFNVKRLLAFSSVAQLGYIVLGLGLASGLGLTAAILHLFNHALAKACLFLIVGGVFYKTGRARITEYRGIARRMPFTMAAFVIAGLSLIGVPFTTGFISKWILIQALMEQDMWYFVIAILVSSLLAVIYIWKIIEAAYFQTPLEGSFASKQGRCELPFMMLISIWILALSNIYFGINTSFTLGAAQVISDYLRMGL